MNLLLARPSEIKASDLLCLNGPRRDHLVDILHLDAGSSIRIGFPDGPQGVGIVESVGKEVHIRHDLDAAMSPETPPSMIHVILALPRPKVLGRVLGHLAALGVQSITLVRSWHVEKSYFQTDLLDPLRSREILLNGLEQAKATRVPILRVFPLFRPYVEDHLGCLIGPGVRLVAHPVDSQSLTKVPIGPRETVTVAIGPERGWTSFECGLLAEQGFEAVSLGARILRVETALTVAVAQVQLLQRLAASQA